MKNFIQPGDTITIPAPAAVKSGDLVQVNALTGVAATDAAQDQPVAISVKGVFALPKSNAVLPVGAPVEWTGTAVASLADGDQIGVVVEAATAGDATAKVLLR
ncbi:DUF2190 family protein [Paracoccus angustae]|uniref:DUF2190 family protein n=1 Tax=Paracoccus angustae TaxID=1671480 RepID=A0ABV7UA66_9RHOB